MNTSIFYSWVPKRLDIFLLLFLHIILAFNSGIPSSISTYVMGANSGVTADLTMINFAYLGGLACVFPFVFRLSQFTNTKLILSSSFIILILLNALLSVTTQPLVMIMVSFVLGFIKMIATIELIIALLPILMPKGERYQLYAIYYPLGMIFAPLSGILATHFADALNWQQTFHSQNLLLFLGLLLIISLIHPELKSKKVPLYQYDWIGNILIIVIFTVGCYICSYGLMLDWFSSPKITSATAALIICTILFLHINMRTKRPYIKFVAFHSWKIVLGLLVLFLLCIFFNTSALLNPFLAIILKNNPVESAKINTFVIPGYIFGSILCYLYFKKYMNFMPMAALACLLFIISNIWMFKITSSLTVSSDLFFPMMLRGTAGIISYISLGIYISNNIPLKFFPDITMVVVAIRIFFVPVLTSTFYSNWYYRLQISYIDQLASKIDKYDPLAIERSSQIFVAVKNQASLLAIRDMYGSVIILGIVVLICIAVIPFHGSTRRIVINWKDPLHVKEVMQTMAS